MQNYQDIQKEHIQQLVAQGELHELVAVYNKKDIHPADWAELLEPLGPPEMARFIEVVGPVEALDFFEFVPFEIQKEVLRQLSRETLAKLISQMSPDDRADLIEDIDEMLQERILSLLIKAERQNILKLINYPDDSAGAYMTTDYALLRHNDSVEAALEQLRLQAPKKETIYYVYVVDAATRLIGFLSLRNLITAPKRELVGNVMNRSIISVKVNEDIEEVANKMQHYDFLAMPVVSEDNRLVGIITYDDIYDVIEEEVQEDMYLLANLDTDESIESSLYRSVKLRVPWLLFNLVTALLVAYTVELFSESISSFVLLAAMMPVVAMLGGNAGNQSLTVVVRALATGEIELGSNWKVLVKEVGVGFLNGLILGGAIGLIALFWFQNVWLALILWATMILNLILAGLVGSMVPITLRRLKLDPALGSSIFVTTATDVGGSWSFWGCPRS